MKPNRAYAIVAALLLLTLTVAVLPLRSAARQDSPTEPNDYPLEGDALDDLGSSTTTFRTNSSSLNGGWRFTEAFTNGLALRANCTSGPNCRAIFALGSSVGVIGEGGTIGVLGYPSSPNGNGGVFTATNGIAGVFTSTNGAAGTFYSTGTTALNATATNASAIGARNNGAAATIMSITSAVARASG